MRRFLWTALAAIAAIAAPGLLAQQSPPAEAAKQEKTEAAKPAEQEKTETAKPEEKKAEESKPAEAEKPAAPAGEGAVEGSVEFGYRATLGENGSFNAYRSVVNLGEGPKLLNADLRFRPNKKFDEATLLLRGWGGEPYSTARADIRKLNRFNLTADYRNMAMFNYLPSFANPLLGSGSRMNQNSVDTRVRSTDLRLDLFPSSRVSPFFGYTRTTEQGNGIWVFSRLGNEFPVPTFTDNQANHFQGGVQLNFRTLHASLEAGGTSFADDIGSAEGLANRGNNARPFVGRNILLSNLSERYKVDGSSYYTRGSLAFNPVKWASVSTEFTYANPTIDVTYTQASQGSFVTPVTLLAATGSADTFSGTAQMPKPSGSIRADLRPFSKLRIVEWWMTDRMHNAASGLLLQQFATGATTTNVRDFAPDRLVSNLNQQQLEAFLDVGKGLMLRGGHRYRTGDLKVRGSIYNPITTLQDASLKSHVGLAGFDYRWGSRLRLNTDFEAAKTDDAFFRTSLRDYRKFRFRGSYAPFPSPSWRLSFDHGTLINTNPSELVNLDFSSKASSAILEYFPKEGKRYTVTAEYTRSSLYSRLNILTPETLRTIWSDYTEAGNTGTLLFLLKPSSIRTGQPGLSFGGSFYSTSGTRPVRYYQPQARMTFDLHKRVAANVEWRWYSMTQRFFALDNFGRHLLVVSMTLHR